MKKRNGEISEKWDELAKGTPFKDGEAFRMWVKNRANKAESVPDESIPEQKESVEIHKDGSQSSHRLVRMSFEESKDVNFLLKSHGYDTDAWELISARSNIWNAYSKQDGIQTLYSSRITVKPRNTFSFDRLIDSIRDIQPINIDIKPIKTAEKKLLEIPLFDQHFGISDYEYYKPTQARIADKIQSIKWEQILFIIGQDLLHNDNFRGQTANGTQIETVDMTKAWNDALKFYSPLLELSLKRSQKTKVIYSIGNHDESMSWAFVQMLKAMYPQIEFDDALEQRKCHTYGKNFIGVTHGDKAKKNLHNLFPIEFPMQWAQATNREIHTGHQHIEETKDIFGIVVRTLCTRNRTDRWHKNEGFNGAHKRFEIFEYSREALENIHYV